MTPEEVKDKLKDVVNFLIKDQPEEATKAFHDVLSVKMRAKINPPEETPPETTETPETGATPAVAAAPATPAPAAPAPTA